MCLIAITGSNGTLGRTLAKLLENKGNNVLRFHHSLNEIEKLLKKDEQKIDALVHCAFSRTEDILELTQSIVFSAKVFEICNHYKIPKILNISSRSVYLASKEKIWTEETPVAPINTYGMAKYATELLCNTIFSGTETQFTSLRLASLIGCGMEQRIVTRLIVKAMKQERITIQVPEQTFQYLDVRDAALGIVSLLESDEKVWKSVYCLGPSKELKLKEIIKDINIVMTANGYKVPPVEYLTKTSVKSGVMLTESFNQITGWGEQYDLKDTIKSILIMMKEKNERDRGIF